MPNTQQQKSHLNIKASQISFNRIFIRLLCIIYSKAILTCFSGISCSLIKHKTENFIMTNYGWTNEQTSSTFLNYSLDDLSTIWVPHLSKLHYGSQKKICWPINKHFTWTKQTNTFEAWEQSRVLNSVMHKPDCFYTSASTTRHTGNSCSYIQNIFTTR